LLLEAVDLILQVVDFGLNDGTWADARAWAAGALRLTAAFAAMMENAC
jgi:hypothetical protein